MSCFHGTHKHIAIFTKAHQYTLSQVNPLHPITICSFKIHFTIILLSTSISPMSLLYIFVLQYYMNVISFESR
jgi:hypothetical protein